MLAIEEAEAHKKHVVPYLNLQICLYVYLSVYFCEPIQENLCIPTTFNPIESKKYSEFSVIFLCSPYERKWLQEGYIWV